MKINIHVQGQGRPLVLFHGWGFDTQIWFPLLPLLTQQYQLYLVDLPGCGLSSQMPWEDFKTLLLEQLPVHFALAGWSMGGLFATRLAIEAPQYVTHLINIASTPHFIREKNWPGIDEQVLQSFYRNVINDPLVRLQQFVSLQLQGHPVPPTWIQKAASLPGLEAGLLVLMNWDLRADLDQLTLPVCYMFGQLDAIIPRSTMKTMQKRYHHFNYIMFAKAAHIPFLSHSEQFINALETCLQ